MMRRPEAQQFQETCMKRYAALIAVAVLIPPLSLAQDAASVLRAASQTMGVDKLSSITYYGSGANFNLGQNNNANAPWPRVNANDYVRSIDFSQGVSRATWVTWAVPVQGGAAAQASGQQNITPANMAWAQQLEIWVTPWGFLKGAAANKATVRAQRVGGQRYQVVTWNSPILSPGGQAYKVVGYINSQNLVEKVQTWVENPIFGDMLVETQYSFYRDKDGLKYPAQIVQSRGGWPVFEAFVLGANANPANIQQLTTVPATAGPPPGAPGGPPAPGADASPSEKLAEGVYRIRGAYNALAVDLKDYIVLFEPGPQNEARAQAIIAETRRVIPNKPIKYGVISHHHFDHTGGLAAVVAEGITIVTHDVNKAFLEKALSAPRTLAPDSMSKSGKKPVIEGITGDKRVFTDGTRTVEVHLVQGLPHADGALIAYLPNEKILAYADMFNLPPPGNPVPNPPVIGTGVFADNLARLNLQPEKILSVHSLNPDRLATVNDILSSLGRPTTN
jgi:glyoxylase-like metal-dependent hydrolase (beta-lactamase superfamily II)